MSSQYCCSSVFIGHRNACRARHLKPDIISSVYCLEAEHTLYNDRMRGCAGAPSDSHYLGYFLELSLRKSCLFCNEVKTLLHIPKRKFGIQSKTSCHSKQVDLFVNALCSCRVVARRVAVSPNASPGKAKHQTPCCDHTVLPPKPDCSSNPVRSERPLLTATYAWRQHIEICSGCC